MCLELRALLSTSSICICVTYLTKEKRESVRKSKGKRSDLCDCYVTVSAIGVRSTTHLRGVCSLMRRYVNDARRRLLMSHVHEYTHSGMQCTYEGHYSGKALRRVVPLRNICDERVDDRVLRTLKTTRSSRVANKERLKAALRIPSSSITAVPRGIVVIPRCWHRPLLNSFDNALIYSHLWRWERWRSARASGPSRCPRCAASTIYWGCALGSHRASPRTVPTSAWRRPTAPTSATKRDRRSINISRLFLREVQ